MEQIAVIIVAAGRSERFSGQSSPLGNSIVKKKPFSLLKGQAVWLHSVRKFSNRKDVRQVILVVSPEDRREVEQKYAADLGFMGIKLANGGRERHESVAAGLAVLEEKIEWVAVHDAARPCITEQDIEKVFKQAEQSGAAILATPLVGTIKRAKVVSAPQKINSKNSENPFNGLFHNEKELPVIESTVSRENLWEAQTPQVFERKLLEQAYTQRNTTHATDDSQLVEALGHDVAIVPGEKSNIKITTAFDLKLAEKILELGEKKQMPFSF